MNHDVAVGTGTVLQHSWLLIHRGITACGYSQQLSGVKHVRVAPLAKHRLLYDQQRLVRTAVRIVAIEAALTNRRMLPQKWTALFRVALIALVVDGVGGNQALRLGAVRVVAVRAKHFFFAKGVMRWLEERNPNLFMASRAELLLARLRQQFVVAAVNLMAVNAGQLGFVVLAAMPHCDITARVASQTDRILRGGRLIFCEIHQAADAATAAASHVIGSRSVATLAAFMRRRRVLITAHAVRLICVADELVVVAARAKLCADECGGWGRDRV